MSIPTDRIVAVTPFWLRPKVSEIFLQNIKDIGIRLIAVLNPQDVANRLLMDGTIEVVQNHQNITGQKWNKGLERLMSLDYDWLLVLGSDDLVSIEYFNRILNVYIQ